MRNYNAIIIFDSEYRHVLMCRRLHEPYKGRYNFVGGKLEPGEDGLSAAYRELFEETGITREDTTLVHLLDQIYHVTDCSVEYYVGRLDKPLDPSGEENPLLWVSLSENFTDLDRFAGDGDIEFVLQYIKILGYTRLA